MNVPEICDAMYYTCNTILYYTIYISLIIHLLIHYTYLYMTRHTKVDLDQSNEECNKALETSKQNNEFFAHMVSSMCVYI